MHIALIGFRGVGKTVLADYLKANFSIQVFSTDSYVEKRTASTIKQLIRQKGWAFFRTIEAQALQEAIDSNASVIDTGGGIIELSDNRELLKESVHSIHLKQAFPILEKRLKSSAQRPNLPGEYVTEDLEQIFQKRESLYQEVAKQSINMEAKSLKQVASMLVEYFPVISF